MSNGTISQAIEVSALYYYPIKSCRGIELEQACIAPRGIVNDRLLMLVDQDGEFLTQREYPRMALIEPRLNGDTLTLSAPEMPTLSIECTDDGPRADVIVWRDCCLGVDQGNEVAAWFSTYLADPCRLVRMAEDFVRGVDPRYKRRDEDQVGFADGYPFLLISEESLADLNTRLPVALEMNRFRPNIVIKGCAAYAEDTWKRVRIGDITFDIVKSCARCAITTTNQETAQTGKEPLRTLATYRQVPGRGVMFGQNLVHDRLGTIQTGALVEILD